MVSISIHKSYLLQFLVFYIWLLVVNKKNTKHEKKTIKISQLSRDYTINRTILTYRTDIKNIREFKITIIPILKSLLEKINMKYQVDNFNTEEMIKRIKWKWLTRIYKERWKMTSTVTSSKLDRLKKESVTFKLC